MCVCVCVRVSFLCICVCLWPGRQCCGVCSDSGGGCAGLSSPLLSSPLPCESMRSKGLRHDKNVRPSALLLSGWMSGERLPLAQGISHDSPPPAVPLRPAPPDPRGKSRHLQLLTPLPRNTHSNTPTASLNCYPCVCLACRGPACLNTSTTLQIWLSYGEAFIPAVKTAKWH